MNPDVRCSQDKELHHRLIGGDPTASADLFDLHLDSIVLYLEHVYPSLKRANPELLWDAATDALLNFCQKPTAFDPSRRSLEGYLKMAARGDLLNMVSKEKRRYSKIVPLESVELRLVDGNNNLEEQFLDRLELQTRLQQFNQVEGLDQRDRRIIGLLQTGERRTKVFAEVLGISFLPAKEKQRLVKQHKDRLKAWLKRRKKNKANYGTD